MCDNPNGEVNKDGSDSIIDKKNLSSKIMKENGFAVDLIDMRMGVHQHLLFFLQSSRRGTGTEGVS